MAERGQILLIFCVNSGTIDQKISEIWTAQALLQPILPKSDRLLDPALALLEILVHLELGGADQLPDSYQLLRVEADDAVTIAEIRDADTPENWRADTAWTQGAGTEWLATGTSALLKVPSAVVPFSNNFLLNPAHEDAGCLKVIEAIKVGYDSRILKLLSNV